MINRRVPIIRPEVTRTCNTPRKYGNSSSSEIKNDLQEYFNLKTATCHICLDILHHPVLIICETMCM